MIVQTAISCAGFLSKIAFVAVICFSAFIQGDVPRPPNGGGFWSIILQDYEGQFNTQDKVFPKGRILKNISFASGAIVEIYEEDFWTPFINFAAVKNRTEREHISSTIYYCYSTTTKYYFDESRDARPYLMFSDNVEQKKFFRSVGVGSQQTIAADISYTNAGYPRILGLLLNISFRVLPGEGPGTGPFYDAPFVEYSTPTEPSKPPSRQPPSTSSASDPPKSHKPRTSQTLATIFGVIVSVLFCLSVVVGAACYYQKNQSSEPQAKTTESENMETPIEDIELDSDPDLEDFD